ncbi:SKP1 protein [Salix suchowensis]|nr:SKP1 protein [Salix suchowensis]
MAPLIYTDNKSIPSSKKITLRSSGGESFEVDEAVAVESRTIKRMIEETSASNREVITLPIVSGSILAKVLRYCEKHTGDDKSIAEELRAWDADFVQLDDDTLFQLILAANYLGVERLVDLASEGAYIKK